MECPKALKELWDSFPNGYVNSEWEFVLVDGYDMTIPLRELKNKKEYMAALLMFASESASSGGPYRWSWLNKSWRRKLRAQINHYWQKSFDERDMLIIYETIGDGRNTSLANKFINNGLKMAVLQSFWNDMPADTEERTGFLFTEIGMSGN